MITCTFEDGGTATLRHVTVTVIVFNEEKNKILLVRRSARYSEPNKLALPGGFMGRDENSWETAAREVKEETGYDVEIEYLFRINDTPNRPKEDRQNVEFIYLATAKDQTGEHDTEIDTVSWYDLLQLPSKEEFAFDHLDNIDKYIAYKSSGGELPLLG